MEDNLKILTGVVFLVAAIALPVTIFLVNQPQETRQQAATIPEATVTITPGCPAVNPDGTTNTCRPQTYCLAGEKVKYEGNEMCTQALSRSSFCCTVPKQ